MTVSRRDFLGSSIIGLVIAPWLEGCDDDAPVDPGAPPFSYGRWVERDGLPAFVYDLDQEAHDEALWSPRSRGLPPTRRNWHMIGNRAIQAQVANDGTVALLDESQGMRWLTAPTPEGTGTSTLHDGNSTWGSAFADRPAGRVPLRSFGPTWFEVEVVHRDLTLRRRVLCPDGEAPWLLVRVELELSSGSNSRRLRHVETWKLRPAFVPSSPIEDLPYRVESLANGIRAIELLDPSVDRSVGSPARLLLEALDMEGVSPLDVDPAAPALAISTDLELQPGERRHLWFRFGRDDGPLTSPAATIFEKSIRSLAERIPRARSAKAPQAEREIPWHAAALTGGAAVDSVLGGHTLNQGSAYSLQMGLNAASRDPLQHALPLVYSEPDLALSVLRNSCAWAAPSGELPYALSPSKMPTSVVFFRPSDSNLWALWLASEYAAATGDLSAFELPVGFHPSYGQAEVPLWEHLVRQFRFFVDQVGRGARNHVRIMNADWNDTVLGARDDRKAFEELGSSVLNSAMASWVTRIFSGLARRLGADAVADEAMYQSDDLRSKVREAWNGQWFDRAYAPDGSPVGRTDCWLEVQPWGILCGAVSDEQAKALLRVIDEELRVGSPLGARIHVPLGSDSFQVFQARGEAMNGGIWWSINMTLIWAAARVDQEMAWDEWRRNSLSNHSATYPTIWEGTLSGPDSFNGPEAEEPGRTWSADPLISMQQYPVSNLHNHSQPILSYLRLLGVEPTESGALKVGGGGRFNSKTFSLHEDGSGSLSAAGEVRVQAQSGSYSTTGGKLEWP